MTKLSQRRRNVIDQAFGKMILLFLRRVVWHLEYAKLGREHLSFNPLGTARSPG